MAELKPYTSYVCPTGEGRGHSRIWTGACAGSERDGVCICGAEFVEEDKERWLLSYELCVPGEPWRPVQVVRSKYAATQQRVGLLALIEEGEPIRNVRLVRLVEEAL